MEQWRRMGEMWNPLWELRIHPGLRVSVKMTSWHSDKNEEGKVEMRCGHWHQNSNANRTELWYEVNTALMSCPLICYSIGPGTLWAHFVELESCPPWEAPIALPLSPGEHSTWMTQVLRRRLDRWVASTGPEQLIGKKTQHYQKTLRGGSCKNSPWGTSLVMQWLRLCAPTAGGPGSIPSQGTRFHMSASTTSSHATTKEPASHN